MSDKTKQEKEPNTTGEDKKQSGLFKKKRAGAVLTKAQVEEIKAGRKKLRAELRAAGVKSRKEFELTASSLGLYFDRKRNFGLFLWFLSKYGGWAALGAAVLLLLGLLGMSAIAQTRGHFTINMTDDLFREGFTLSETANFQNPTSHLFATPAENVPCISIRDIPEDVAEGEGKIEGNFFAYNYYIKNEGESTVDFGWELKLNSESKNLSKATWVMIFIDGKMTLYARAQEDGSQEMLPRLDDTERNGYPYAPMYDHAADPEGQYEISKETSYTTYWRLKPYAFRSEEILADGLQTEIAPGEMHKFTIVIWLEGDDPDCTNELIGGHMGLEMYMYLVEPKP